MSDQNTASGLQGTRLPPIKKNGAELLKKEYRDRLIALANALFNLEVLVPQTDGTNIQPPLKATVDISELSMRITMPPNGQPSGGAGGTTIHQFIIVGDGGDFFWALNYDNQIFGAVLQPILKPMKLRAGSNAISTEAIRGGTYNYGYGAGTAGSVTVNGVTYTSQVPYYTRNVTDSATETDYVIPDVIPGVSTIFAAAANLSLPSIPSTILTAVLVAGGTGYTAGTYSITGGTLISGGSAATVTIAVTGGVVTTLTLESCGQYTVAPGLTGATITGGGGSGLTCNLTLSPNLLDLNVDGRAWAH